jgi:hypothetical protein
MRAGFLGQKQINKTGRNEGHTLYHHKQREFACNTANGANAVQHNRKTPAHRNCDKREDSDWVNLKHRQILSKIQGLPKPSTE